jgi:hypothetical protein
MGRTNGSETLNGFSLAFFLHSHFAAIYNSFVEQASERGTGNFFNFSDFPFQAFLVLLVEFN